MRMDALVHLGSLSAAVLALCFVGNPALAESIDAASANASFEDGQSSGVRPQTPSEYLRCAAMWDRWEYFMLSSNIPEFNRDIGTELSATAARKQSSRLRRKARTLAKRSGENAALRGWTAQGEAAADDKYAAFINNETGAARAFLTTLGTCK